MYLGVFSWLCVSNCESSAGSVYLPGGHQLALCIYLGVISWLFVSTWGHQLAVCIYLGVISWLCVSTWGSSAGSVYPPGGHQLALCIYLGVIRWLPSYLKLELGWSLELGLVFSS